MATLTERITKLTQRIEKWDAQMDEITLARQTAIDEIQSLLGLSGSAKSTAVTPATKKKVGKLGDQIKTMMEAFNGQTREFYANRIKTTPSKAGLALYHLKHKGDVVERDGTFWLRGADATAATAKASAVDTEPAITE